jgi:hypothetical protein
MDFTVKKGDHHHRIPPFSHLPWAGKQRMERTVIFNASCAYEPAVHNPQDVNRLFGLSFGLLPRRVYKVKLAGIGTIGRAIGRYELVSPLYYNSACFGWRWNHTQRCVDLLAYCYTEGERDQHKPLDHLVVAQLRLNKPYKCCIDHHKDALLGNHHLFSVWEFADADRQGFLVGGARSYNQQQLPSYGLTYGLQLGSSLPAPHDINVTINRI